MYFQRWSTSYGTELFPWVEAVGGPIVWERPVSRGWVVAYVADLFPGVGVLIILIASAISKWVV